MNWDDLDWPALERLREAFLGGTAGRGDYWTSERALLSYDQTFGRRIAWKWTSVLVGLRQRGWSPPAGPVLDWGCGTGVAGRTFAGVFGAAASETWAFWDRSPLALGVAARLAALEHPGLQVQTALPEAPATLLLSHVLPELPERTLEEVLTLARAATTILWVEPGTRDLSRRLIAVREQFRGTFHLVAPCTHAAPCGLLAPGNEPHWCHHFAPPPPEVFTDGNWVRFGRMMGIDLRSLPLSYLVLDRRPMPALPADAFRVLGRPRVYKAHALLLGCNAAGVREYRLTRRVFPDEFRRLRKGHCPSLQCWTCEGEEIRQCGPPGHPVEPPAPARE